MSGQEVGLSRRLVGACAGLVISLLAVPLDGQEHAQGAQPREGNPPRVVRDLTGNLSPAEELAAVERALASAPNEELGLRLRDKHFGLSMLDGELLGFALSWKAHFMDRAVRFTPALGQAVETTQSLELELASIRVGEAPLYVKAAAASERTHAEKRVRYAVQPGLTEVWEASPDGLELSYVFDTLPTRGELVVSLDLATEMVATETGRTAGPLRFRAGEVDALSIGEVWGIDAAGRRAQGWLHTDGSSLELGLPAAFVEEAELPLVLDPLISGAVSTANVLDLGAPDLAYDFLTGTYGTAFEIEFSATDRDVHAAIFTTNPLAFLQGFIVSGVGGDDEVHPAIAGGTGDPSNNFGFRIAYEVVSAGSSSVRSRALFVSGTVGTEQTWISGAGRPDIMTLDPGFVQVAAAESDGTVHPAGIVMSLLQAGTFALPVEQVSTDTASRFDERPRFSQSVSGFVPTVTGGFEFAVVWDRLFVDDPNPGDTDYDVAARAYEFIGGLGSALAPLSTATLVATSIGTQEFRAALGGPAPFLSQAGVPISADKLVWTFVFQFDQSVSPFEKGIYAKTFELPESGLATDPLVVNDPGVLVEDDVGQDEEWPAIAAVATSGAYPQSFRPFGQYLVSWTEDDVGGNPAIFARGIKLYLGTPCEDEFLVGPTAGVSPGAVGASTIASNAWNPSAGSPEAMIAFGALDPLAGPDFIVGYNAGNGDIGSIEAIPTGCPESIGIHSYVGCAAPNRAVFGVLDDSDPSFDLAIGLVSLSRLDPGIACGCGDLIVDIFGSTFWAITGDPSGPGALWFGQLVLGDPAVVGLKYYVQFAVGTTGPPVSSCSLGFDFTTAFAVTIGAGN